MGGVSSAGNHQNIVSFNGAVFALQIDGCITIFLVQHADAVVVDIDPHAPNYPDSLVTGKYAGKYSTKIILTL
jgi:hypothetical protein